jgi:hypothetical protein
MNLQEIQSLLALKAPGCLSIVLPLYRTSPGRQQNDLHMRRAMEDAKKLIQSKTKGDGMETDEILHRLEEMYHAIDFVHSPEGIGLFVSTHLSRMIEFPFPVHEEIEYDDHFSRLALYRLLFTRRNFMVLSLRQDSVHLYRGEARVLTEVLNHDFPKFYEETYEYGKPEHIRHFGSTISKSVEPDKKQMERIRLEAFYRSIDSGLDNYLDETSYFLVAGGKKERKSFKEVSEHTKFIFGEIEGQFSFASIHTLGEKAWQIFQEQIAHEDLRLIEHLTEWIGEKRAVAGLDEVWTHVMDKRGLTLYIDPFHLFNAFMSPTSKYIYTHLSHIDKTLQPILHPLDMLIEKQLEYGGNVQFMDENSLDAWDGIALQLRF